jgi:hypothetical protein
MTPITKTFSAAAASLMLAAAMAAAPAPAQAKNGVNGALAAGAIGGLALGAILSSRPAYAAPVHDEGPGYGRRPVYGIDEECYIVRQRVRTAHGPRWINQTICD